MIIWTGYGFLVAVFVFGFSLAANLLCNLFTGNGTYWELHRWPLGISLVLSAAACWLVGQVLRHRGARILIDPSTNREVVLGRSHTLFFIPMQYWGPILAVLGAVAVISDLGRSPETVADAAKEEQHKGREGSPEMQFEIVGSPAMEPGDEVEAVDNIRLGDIVFFDRTGPKKVALRVLSPEEAAKVSGKKYRIDRGSKPGSFKLTQLED